MSSSVCLHLSRRDRPTWELTEVDIQNVLEHLRKLDEVDVKSIRHARHSDGVWRVSLRTRTPLDRVDRAALFARAGCKFVSISDKTANLAPQQLAAVM